MCRCLRSAYPEVSLIESQQVFVILAFGTGRLCEAVAPAEALLRAVLFYPARQKTIALRDVLSAIPGRVAKASEYHADLCFQSDSDTDALKRSGKASYGLPAAMERLMNSSVAITRSEQLCCYMLLFEEH